jgi:hypothetical protein
MGQIKAPPQRSVGFGLGNIWISFHIFVGVFQTLGGIYSALFKGQWFSLILGSYFILESVVLLKKRKLGVYLAFLELILFSVGIMIVIFSSAVPNASALVVPLIACIMWFIYFLKRFKYFGTNLQTQIPVMRASKAMINVGFVILAIFVIYLVIVSGIVIQHYLNKP